MNDITNPDEIAFRAWRDTFELKHWSNKDLGACRLGWDAALAWIRGEHPDTVSVNIYVPAGLSMVDTGNGNMEIHSNLVGPDEC